MNGRYELRDVGVFDHQAGVLLRFGDPGWNEYQAFVMFGGAADVPQVVVTIDIEAVRAEQLALVNNQRDAQLAAGVVFAGNRYDSDPSSAANLVAAVTAITAGLPLPDGFTWRTADNQDVPFDATMLVQLAGAMLLRSDACYRNSWDLKAAIEAADDPGAIDITQGWPA